MRIFLRHLYIKNGVKSLATQRIIFSFSFFTNPSNKKCKKLRENWMSKADFFGFGVHF